MRESSSGENLTFDTILKVLFRDLCVGFFVAQTLNPHYPHRKIFGNKKAVDKNLFSISTQKIYFCSPSKTSKF